MKGKTITGVFTLLVVIIAILIGGFIHFRPYGLVFQLPGITKISSQQILLGHQSRLAEAASRVEIIRDEWGTPHIYGKTDRDVAFGIAFAHAEDDFANIQKVFLIARGKLSSVFGQDSGKIDYFQKLIHIEERAEKYWNSQHTPESQAIMESYVDGLHYYALLHPNELLSNDPDALFPVSAKDISKLFLALIPNFIKISKQIGVILEEDPYYVVSYGSRPVSPEPVSENVELDSGGSNAVALGPNRTLDESTLLAINSHQPWEGLAAWYEINVHSEEGWDMTGAVFPGSPVLIHGHNLHLGWAHTVNQPDIFDIYLLRTDPAYPDQYYFDGEWKPLEMREIEIEVKVWGPLYVYSKQKIYWSVHGPVLIRNHGTYAFRYAGYKNAGAVEQYYRMNKATNLEEFKSAFSMKMIPMFNAVYADKTGQIYYKYNALLPLRNTSYLWDNLLDGSVSATLWNDYLEWDKLPEVLNPKSGFIQNCNSAPWNTTALWTEENPIKSNFHFSLGIESRMTNRALRFLELLDDSSQKLSWEDFLTIKYDMNYSKQSIFVEHIRRLLDELEFDDSIQNDPNLAKAYQVLSEWDFGTNPENKGAALGVLTIHPFIQLHSFERDPLLQVREHFYVIVENFKRVASMLTAFYGRPDVEWQHVNRIIRGELNMGLGGGPDVPHTVIGNIVDGKHVGYMGDCHFLMVKWDKDGKVYSEAILPFGTSSKPSSVHYHDQTSLFVQRKLRKVHFFRDDVLAHASKIYVPGQL